MSQPGICPDTDCVTRRFAVVEVASDFDYVEGVKCLDVFADNEEAEAYRHGLMQEESASTLALVVAVEEYLKGLEVPDLSYIEWKKYTESFGFIVEVLPQNFKTSLRLEMLSNKHLKVPGFARPQVVRYGDLFVVEIKKGGQRVG